MDRIRRLSTQLLEKYPAMFTDDFKANKEKLDQVTKVLSKQLKNELAGRITSAVRKRTTIQETAPPTEEAPPAAEQAA